MTLIEKSVRLLVWISRQLPLMIGQKSGLSCYPFSWSWLATRTTSMEVYFCSVLCYLSFSYNFLRSVKPLRWILWPNSTVHGALRCLALLSGDLDDKDVPALVPVLFPCLHAVVSSPQVCITFFGMSSFVNDNFSDDRLSFISLMKFTPLS